MWVVLWGSTESLEIYGTFDSWRAAQKWADKNITNFRRFFVQIKKINKLNKVKNTP